MSAVKEGVLNSTVAFDLGFADPNAVCQWFIQILGSTDGTTWVGTLQFQGRARGASTIAMTSGVPTTIAPVIQYAALVYRDLNSSDPTASAALTDPEGLYLVEASGMDVRVLCSAYTSGAVAIYANPVIG